MLATPLPVELGTALNPDQDKSSFPRALVVDDEKTNRLVLSAMLKNDGFEVITACDGLEGIEQFEAQNPDVIFMDVMMPNMDGLESTRVIKSRAKDNHIPIIFVTALTDETQLAKCIDAGGDDFINKPFSRTVLRAKTTAAMRMRQLHTRVSEQRDQLAEFQINTERDFAIASRILDNISTEKALSAPNVQYLLRPMELLNGDVIFSALKPSGAQCFLVGDFTGHGLPAAIGALTVHGIFCSMASKGFDIGDIAAELNSKLLELLPIDRFFSACLIELDSETGVLKVWNGGCPEIYVINAAGDISMRFPSTYIPLGISDAPDITNHVTRAILAPGDRIFAYSDGLTEAQNTDGEMFGSDQLLEIIKTCPANTSLFDRIYASFSFFVLNADQSDDISILEVEFDPDLKLNDTGGESIGASKPPTTWGFEIELQANALKLADPLPGIIQLCDVLQGLQAHRQRLYTILTELFSNALEHGLLDLDSALKSSPDGFGKYYSLREERLEKLEGGILSVRFDHVATDDGGILTITVTHNGLGYDTTSTEINLEENLNSDGRGIPLVRSLCHHLRYEENGCQAIAEYHWSSGQT